MACTRRSSLICNRVLGRVTQRLEKTCQVLSPLQLSAVLGVQLEDGHRVHSYAGGICLGLGCNVTDRKNIHTTQCFYIDDE